jgi:hypothetical protein
MEDAKQKLLDLNISGVVVSVIIELERDGSIEVLRYYLKRRGEK